MSAPNISYGVDSCEPHCACAPGGECGPKSACRAFPPNPQGRVNFSPDGCRGRGGHDDCVPVRVPLEAGITQPMLPSLFRFLPLRVLQGFRCRCVAFVLRCRRYFSPLRGRPLLTRRRHLRCQRCFCRGGEVEERDLARSASGCLCSSSAVYQLGFELVLLIAFVVTVVVALSFQCLSGDVVEGR